MIKNMSINIKTASGAYAVNASRIEKFIKAETRDQALHMGGWDKFKDMFRTGDEKKAFQIAKIYDSITAGGGEATSHLGMADRFKHLRDMASDQCKPLFTIQCEKSPQNHLWEFSFSIGNDRIFERKNMLDTHTDSFESIANYQKYFEGLDNTTPPPEAITDLNSGLRGVLHEMTGPQSGERSVLQALAHVRDLIRKPVASQDPAEQREILLANGHKPAVVDHLLKHAQVDPIGFRLGLALKPDLDGEDFLGPLDTAINQCVDDLPRHQLLAIADFYRANPYFADGLRQAGTLGLPEAQETLDLDSGVDPRFWGVMSRAGFVNDLGKISKLLFNAVERSLAQDIYRTYPAHDESWQLDLNAHPNPTPELSRVIQVFLCGTQDFATTLAPAAARQNAQAPSGDLALMPLDNPLSIEPWVVRV